MKYMALVKGMDSQIEEEVTLEIEGVEFTGFALICPYTIEDIFDAVNCFNEAYYDMYLYRFKGNEYPMTNSVWLGGGSGFCTKTILYALLGQEKGVEAAIAIFQKTLPVKISQEHKHYKDKRIGISPHTLKTTKYQGKSYPLFLQ